MSALQAVNAAIDSVELTSTSRNESLARIASLNSWQSHSFGGVCSSDSCMCTGECHATGICPRIGVGGRWTSDSLPPYGARPGVGGIPWGNSFTPGSPPPSAPFPLQPNIEDKKQVASERAKWQAIVEALALAVAAMAKEHQPSPGVYNQLMDALEAAQQELEASTLI